MTLGAAVTGSAQFKARRLVILPWSALASRDGEPAVWVVNRQTRAVSLKPVTIDAYKTGELLIRDGLEPGEIVVTAGGQLLRPDQTVALAPEAAPMTARDWLYPVLLIPLALAACKEDKDEGAARSAGALDRRCSANRQGLGFTGTVEPQYRAILGFRVLGRLIVRHASVGDVVHKGALLAALDPVALELAVRAAAADLSNALAQLANATATETRQRTLLEQKTTTEAQFELAQQAREAAAAAVVRARANLAKAQEQLGYAELRSDFDGVVTAVDAEVGQVVSAGQTGGHGRAPGHPRGGGRRAGGYRRRPASGHPFRRRVCRSIHRSRPPAACARSRRRPTRQPAPGGCASPWTIRRRASAWAPP